MLWLLASSACGFPRPPDVAGDAGVAGDGGADAEPASRCTVDEACGDATPFCVDQTCAACKSSMSCSEARPVCDPASHVCRNCVKDSECDSGACDLAAGTCVDQSKILYASPGGTPADPCARLLPCSLDKAARSVDAGHPYIVMLPGVHTASVTFNAQNATVCGNDAMMDTNVALIRVDAASSVKIRDLRLIGGNVPDLTVIVNSSSEMSLENVTIDLSSGGVYAIDTNKSSSTQIRGSAIIHGTINANGSLVIDSSRFLDSSIGIFQSEGTRSSITNSTFVASKPFLYIADPVDGSFDVGAYIANNTFVGGGVSCGQGTPVTKTKYWVSNVFFNTAVVDTMPGCHYDFNLFMPFQDLGGTGNITGDPMFVNAAGNDFHVRAGSRTIDAGDPTPLMANTHDHDGTVRPQGAAPDIGAFEYVP